MNIRINEPRYRKGSRIFWVLVGDDILLRNYLTNAAIQLEPQQRKVWELLDGAHTVPNITEKLMVDREFKLSSADISELIDLLNDSGFLQLA